MAGVHLGLFLIFGRWLGERDGMGMTKKFVHEYGHLANGLAVENYVWNRDEMYMIPPALRPCRGAVQNISPLFGLGINSP
jgi:hypothetical protein